MCLEPLTVQMYHVLNALCKSIVKVALCMSVSCINFAFTGVTGRLQVALSNSVVLQCIDSKVNVKLIV